MDIFSQHLQFSRAIYDVDPFAMLKQETPEIYAFLLSQLKQQSDGMQIKFSHQESQFTEGERTRFFASGRTYTSR